jgi:hypothetical protein
LERRLGSLSGRKREYPKVHLDMKCKNSQIVLTLQNTADFIEPGVKILFESIGCA